MIKIIAGSARGRIIKSPPKSPHVRPILARIKKSLFDIIAPRLPGSRFLDLFSGTGPVGLEALSRGASQVSFMERDRQCVRILRENVAMLRMEEKVSIFTGDVLSDLRFLPKPFDLIFMGPPYKDDDKKPLALVAPTIDNLLRCAVPAEKALIMAQHHKKENIHISSPDWECFRQERYGDTLLSFFRARP